METVKRERERESAWMQTEERGECMDGDSEERERVNGWRQRRERGSA